MNKKTSVKKDLEAALIAAYCALPLPNHTGAITSKGEPLPLHLNDCACPTHTAHRLTVAAMSRAGLLDRARAAVRVAGAMKAAGF
jgi:hypothetical protein